MKTATGNNLLRAYNRAAKRIKDDNLTSAATSAGFIIPAGQKRGQRKGWQIFVMLIAYSDAKLAKNRCSGGLAVKI